MDDKIAEAKVMQVTVTGTSGQYSFAVTIKSPDTGCDQYADWWEVVSESGELIYRRILAHSHVDEQPFTRSGGGVNVTENQTVIIRMHMNTTGYSDNGMMGSVGEGFSAYQIPEGFAAELADQAPLPDGCAF